MTPWKANIRSAVQAMYWSVRKVFILMVL